MNAVYRFDTFELCPARRELKRAAQRVDLPASAFDCLVYLVQHRERAVGRDELIAAVWGLADISESLLAQAIVRVRRALGDTDASTQRSIRTVTKFGYHWIANTQVDEPTAQPNKSPAPSSAVASAPSNSSDDVIVLPATVDAASDAAWLRLGIMELVACCLRCADIPVTRGDEVIVLLHVFPNLAQAQADDERELPLRAPRRVYPTVRRDSSAWRVELTCRDAQRRVAVDAVDADVTVAARKATGELLALLNR